jgi:signal transduction histidine kinase
METGFYPFVFDRTTARCVAHGANPDWVGKTLQEIFEEMGIGFSLTDELHKRFVEAAEKGGDWVQYFWRETPESDIANKIAFVTDVTDQFYLGVGYSHVQLPLELPCTEMTDSWCSMNNVRSLVGKAETALKGALSIEQFESTLHEISFNREEYFVEGGHYLFMYHYDGPLKAHFHLNRFAGESLPYMFEQLNRNPQEGADLHVALRAAAEGVGDGWVQYPWKNTPEEPEYTKIAFVVNVQFMGENYLLGCGYNFIMGDVVFPTYAMEVAARNEDIAEEEVSCPGYNLPCSFGNTLQLSSHTLSHGLSSPLALDDTFAAITDGTQFKIDGWGYAFMFDFNGTCVAHAVKEFVGLTGTEMFEVLGIDSVDGLDLHNRFKKAAQLGGGFVLYDWSDAKTPNDMYQKVSYIFSLTRDGRSYYGGVGFNHERAPLYPNLDTGFQINGAPIPCSSDYGSECSELNSQAILGQALGDLVLSSSETKVRLSSVKQPAANVQEVFSNITAGSDLYKVNDFHVAVFALDQSLCYEEGETVISRDDSGCCVAHGGNSSYVGMTWQGILDSQSITSIRGRDLHDRLTGQIDSGGEWMLYSWAQSSGGARPKIAFASRFRDNDQSYYVMVEYFAELPPPTCSACPSGMACTREGQFFCEPQEEKTAFYQTAGFIILMLVVIGVPCLAFCFCYIGKKREERMARAQLQEYDQQMQTMTEKMEHQEKTAKKANKLVASLFPQQVHERVMQQLDEENDESSTADVEEPDDHIATKEQWNNYMAGVSINPKTIKANAPIADLFPAATISFADIVGFTAWSSTREPSQVFHLLESIYRKFDKYVCLHGVCPCTANLCLH